MPLDDGMAGLWIVHTADKIQQIWVVLQALANLTKRHTPTTSPTTPTDASCTGADTPATADGGANSGTAAAAGATTTADAEAGAAPDAAPDAGVVTGTTTSAPHAGTITDDGGAEADPAANATNGRVRDERTAGQRRADMVADLFEFMLWNGLDWLGRRLPDQHRRRPHIEVLTPLSTLLGLDDEPCELTGYGPIPAEMGRRIAADGTWRRILTDPTNGTVLEASTTRHDPGALVSETLLAAHPICDWINCNRAARESDRDHGTPYAQTGATNPADLRSYCELHHIIKDTPRWGWKATNNPDGSTTLTAPHRPPPHHPTRHPRAHHPTTPTRPGRRRTTALLTPTTNPHP